MKGFLDLLGTHLPGEDEGVDYLKHLDSVDSLEIEEFENEPYYFDADESTGGYKNKHGFSLMMRPSQRPTIATLVETCRVDRTMPGLIQFEQGMWVEFLSRDMTWNVGVISRVVKQPPGPKEWDYGKENAIPPFNLWKVSYNIAGVGVIRREDIRAPTIGLQSIFGKRPWLWQQFTLLQLERRTRFDFDNESDFEVLDYVQFAAVRYDRWLNAPENADFKELHDKEHEITRHLLKKNLMSPFLLMNEISQQNELWDFSDGDISLYTYMSVLGAGVMVTVIGVAIQVIGPLVLFYSTLFVTDGELNQRFDVELDEDGISVVASNGGFFPSTDFNQFCRDFQSPQTEGKILIALVVLVYITTILPESFQKMYRATGVSGSTFSKINGLRRSLWVKNEDTILQQIGFKVQSLMNTGYVCILYGIMLFILLQTPNVLDLILNALAIDFIAQYDNRIAHSEWWDVDRRWLKAGTIEMVFRNSLCLKTIENPYRLCQKYDIDYKTYSDVLGGAKPLKSLRQARKDEMNQKFMTKKERVFAAVVKYACDGNLTAVIEEYKKDTVGFGYADTGFSKLFGFAAGFFTRFTAYRTWSRWEKILFLPKLPIKAEAEVETGTTKKGKQRHKDKAANVQCKKNGSQHVVTLLIRILLGIEWFTSTLRAFKNGHFLQIPILFVLGMLEYVFLVIQLTFPLALFTGLFGLPFCY